MSSFVIIVVLLLAHTFSSDLCEHKNVVTNFGDSVCEISYEDCGTYRDFKKCGTNQGQQLEEQEKCLNRCCGLSGFGLSSNQFQTCMQGDQTWLSNEQNQVLLIAGACIFPTILIIILCICVCKRSRKKVNTTTISNKKQSASEQQNKKNQQISIGMIFVEEKNPQNLKSSKNECSALKEDERQKLCQICLTKEINCMTSCSHYFHSSCLKQWALRSSTKKRCPIPDNYDDTKSNSQPSSQEQSPQNRLKLTKQAYNNLQILQTNHDYEFVYVYCLTCMHLKEALTAEQFLDKEEKICKRLTNCQKASHK